MSGIYWLLVQVPFGASAFTLYFLTLGMIFLLRDKKEGLYYNTSYSAMIGDGALLSIAVSAISMLKAGGHQPEWLTPQLQFMAFLVSACVGLMWFLRDRPKYPADCFHHLVIAPLLLFLLITLVPVIIKNGTWGDIITMPCFVAIWAGLVRFDAKNGRLEQRKYHHLGTFLNSFWEGFKK